MVQLKNNTGEQWTIFLRKPRPTLDRWHHRPTCGRASGREGTCSQRLYRPI